MPQRSLEKPETLKGLITLAALSILLLRIVLPDIRIDAVSLGLLILAILPWLAPLIKSAELPGGWKIEFQDIKEAAERIEASDPVSAQSAPTTPEPSYLAIADLNPSLALVGLRIEIEKRLRAIAERYGIPRTRALTQQTVDLQARGVLDPAAASGLMELITFGNQAAHGVDVAPDVATSSIEYGPRVLRVLDAILARPM